MKITRDWTWVFVSLHVALVRGPRSSVFRQGGRHMSDWTLDPPAWRGPRWVSRDLGKHPRVIGGTFFRPVIQNKSFNTRHRFPVAPSRSGHREKKHPGILDSSFKQRESVPVNILDHQFLSQLLWVCDRHYSWLRSDLSDFVPGWIVLPCPRAGLETLPFSP